MAKNTTGLYSEDKIEDIFYYDETSPGCLRWKINRYKGKNYTQLHVKVGAVVGTKTRSGYYQVNINCKSYLVHRLVYAVTRGISLADINGVIDHKDRNRGNNSLQNLRKASHSQNQQNKCKSIGNTSGFTGVSFSTTYSRGKPYYYVTTTWRTPDGESHVKGFSVKAYGLLPAFSKACNYREKILLELNSSGCDYQQNHGK
jgi:hypothetical protein